MAYSQAMFGQYNTDTVYRLQTTDISLTLVLQVVLTKTTVLTPKSIAAISACLEAFHHNDKKLVHHKVNDKKSMQSSTAKCAKGNWNNLKKFVGNFKTCYDVDLRRFDNVTPVF